MILYTQTKTTGVEIMDEVKTISGGVAVDDRGSIRFANDFDFEGVKRFYQIQNHEPMFIRAWHGHQHEAKYIYVAKGTAVVGVAPIEGYENHEHTENRFVLSDQKPVVLYIPKAHFNGIMTFTPDTIVQVFSTSTLEESLGDDIRLSYRYWDIWDVERR